LAADYKTDETDIADEGVTHPFIRFIRHHASAANPLQA
jgi:hypothetical protein